MARRWFDFYTRQSIDLGTSNPAWIVETRSFGRQGAAPDDDSPYLIANEWVASNIGWFLRVHVPPFALMRRAGHKGMFVSLHIDPRKLTQPPDAKPVKLVERDADLCTGILLFDVLIANVDRHAGNILVDDPQSPLQIDVIDHDRAVFGHFPGEVRARLTLLWNHLAVTGNTGITGEQRHCLIDAVTTPDHFWKWMGRISAIPDGFVKDICDEVVGIGVTKEDADLAASFLINRKRNFDAILRANKAEFTAIQKRGWNIIL
jgi:hypothetical protein